MNFRPNGNLYMRALLVGGFLFFASVAPVLAQTVIFQNNFDGRSAGPYTDADLDEDFDEPNFNNGVTEGRVRVVSGAAAFGGNGSALEVTYPANDFGTSGTGAQWRLSFDDSFEEATLSYRVRFGAGFDFVRGGKLPGLAGGTSPTGSTQATGFNGWTGRIMWRTQFNGVSGQPQQLTSGGITYAKYTDSGFSMDGVQEDRNPFFNPDGERTEFVSNQWYQITQRIVMNTPGEFNGIQQIWVDGVLVINEQDLRYRLTDAFAIDQMYFSTFFGGGSDWSTSKAEVAFFDDFVITVPGDGGSTDPPADPPPSGDGPLLVPSQFASIAAAVDAASDGDVIQVSGTVTGNAVVDKSVCIEGVSSSVVVQPSNENSATIIVDANNVVLKNFTIIGGSQGVVVRSDSEDVEIENLFVRDASNVGILAQSRADGLAISNTEIRDCGSDGIRATNCDGLTLTDNFSNRNAGHGIRLNSSDNANLMLNLSKSNNLHGYDLRGNGHSVVNNDSTENALRGMVIRGNGHFLFDNLARDNGSHGMTFDFASGCTVFDNRSRFNGTHGFRVWNNSSDNVFDDNNVTGNGNHGFLIGGGASSNSVINSFVFENGGTGILLNSTTVNTFVSENVIRCNVGAGIGDFGDNQIEDNIVRDNGQ